MKRCVMLLVAVTACHEGPSDKLVITTAAAPAPASPRPEPAVDTKPNTPQGTIGESGYPSTIQGQLDRIDTEDQKRHFEDTAEELAKHRKLTGWLRESVEPAVVANRFWSAQKERKNTPITYAMLKKNAERYAGSQWYAYGAKILEIQEKDGATIGRVSVAGKDYFVAGRFLTDFVEGDSVDVVGYLAGTFEYTSRANWNLSIPAVALAGMLKPGGLNKLNEYFTTKERAFKKEKKH